MRFFCKPGQARAASGRRKAVRLFVCVAGALALQEAALRFFFPLPEVAGFNRSRYMNRPADDRDLPPVRSIRLLWESAPDNAHSVHALNRYGFRDGEWKQQATPGRPRIMLVGDSFTEGAMAPADQTLPRAFEERLSDMAGAPAEVMNMGVMGAGFGHYLQLLADALPLFRPDHVIMVFHAGDVIVQPWPVTPRPAPAFRRATPRIVELARMTRAGAMLPMRRAVRSARFHKPISDPDNLWHGRADLLRTVCEAPVATAIEQGRFNAWRVGGSRYLATLLAAPFDFTPGLRQAREQARRYGASLSVVYLPDRGQVTRHYRPYEDAYSVGFPECPDLTEEAFQMHRRQMARDCRALGIPFLDFHATLKREEDRGVHLFWNYDDHLRGMGYTLLGRELATWWHTVWTPSS